MRRRRSERGGECLFRAFVCGAVSLSVTQLVILGAASLRGEFTVHTLLHGARRDDSNNAPAPQAPVPPPPPPHEVPITDGAAVAAQVGGIHLHDGSILLTKKSAMRDLRGDGGILKTIVRQGDAAGGTPPDGATVGAATPSDVPSMPAQGMKLDDTWSPSRHQYV